MSRSKPGNLLLRRESQDAAPPRAATRAQRDAHRPMCYREELSRAKRTGAAAGKRARRGRACWFGCPPRASWYPQGTSVQGASASVRDAPTGTIGNVTGSGTAVRTLSAHARRIYERIYFLPGGGPAPQNLPLPWSLTVSLPRRLASINPGTLFFLARMEV